MAYKKLKYWFDKDLAILLSDRILSKESHFDKVSYVNYVDKKVELLELKDRVEVLADGLHEYLGGAYQENIELLTSILGPENREETGMFTNFYWVMPIAKYIEKYGLEYFSVSMKAMVEVTKRNTSEYTIRPFLDLYPRKTLKKMLQWTKSNNAHVRRLASEGGRPRLPWAKKMQRFIEDPSPLIPVLEALKDDTSKYVQNSVANCLNDILKDNFDVGLSIINSWIIDASTERKWIIKHAIRNGRKKKENWAISILEKLEA